MNEIIKQRQGRAIGIVPIKGINGDLRYENIFAKKSWQELTIAKTINTNVTCRVCLGSGMITNVDSIGMYLDSICPHCKGSKKMLSV